MKFFNLPDLGEGIPEADIVKWHIQEGDSVTEDQVIVSVETAKAVVEVPSPVTGVVARLCAASGDTVLTGAPLVEFVSDQEDTGTVVGKLESQPESDDSNDTFFIGTPPASEQTQKISSKGSLDRTCRTFWRDPWKAIQTYPKKHRTSHLHSSNSLNP